MADINLLPEDFRKREEKERAYLAKQPRVFEVPLSQPAKNGVANLRSDKPRESWWSKIFGSRKRQPMPPPVQKMPQFTPTAKMDLLERARKQKIAFTSRLKPAPKPKKSFWASFFGAPRSPIKPPEPVPPPKIQIHSAEIELKRPMAARIKIAEPKVKRSFWQRLFGGYEKKPRAVIFSKPVQFKPAPTLPPAKPSFVPPPIREEKKKEIIPPAKKSWRLFGFGAAKKTKAEKLEPLEAKPAPEKVQPPKMEKSKININLIPQELISIKYYSPHWQAAIIFIAVILAGSVVFGLYWLIDFQQKTVDGKIAAAEAAVRNLSASLADYQKQYEKNIHLEKKLLVINDLLANHIYWTKFFSLLEKYTLDGVYFTSISADASGELILPARADNYSRVAEQLVALRNAPDFVKKAEVDEIKLEVSSKSGIVGVSFELKLKLANGVFKK